MFDDRLQKLRSRWIRWLGQKRSRYGGVELLDCNFDSWKRKVLSSHAVDMQEHKDCWRAAIDVATEEELRTLDCICIDEASR